jgi:AMP-binding enzyme C-terminal domain
VPFLYVRKLGSYRASSLSGGGENVYPGDIERMLERHADVSQAAVVPIDDEMKGQKPVVFIVPKTGRHPSEDEIKQFALANGPAYQHPRFIWFVDKLPLASTNKIDRGALRQARGTAGEKICDDRHSQPITGPRLPFDNALRGPIRYVLGCSEQIRKWHDVIVSAAIQPR